MVVELYFNKSFNIVTVASLRPVKGIDILIKAISLIKDEFKITYEVIGEGPDRPKLQNLITELKLEDSVFLCGQKLNPDKDLDRADIFIFGSWYEGMPNAVLEAMSKKLPIVSTKAKNGVQEIITHNYNGLLCDRGDYHAMAKLIKKLIVSSSLRKKLSDNGFETIKSNFNFEDMLRSYEKLLVK